MTQLPEGYPMRSLVLFLLVLLCPMSVAAQGIHTLVPGARPEAVGLSSDRLARIDTLMAALVARLEIPGAVALIVRHGEIAYFKAWGYRNVETRAPLRTDDIFRIASQSKAITALAVMMLWEEGRFQLDDAVARYLPAFAKPQVLTSFNAADTTWESEPARSGVTIRQLLTHTSGIDYASIGSREFRAIYAKAGVPSGIGNDRDRLADKMTILGGLPLRHQPGERFTYGLNSDVLGYLVEVLSGQPFDEFLRTRIFQPLGMHDTWFYLPAAKHDRLVTLHDGESGTVLPLRARAYDDVDPDYPKLPGTYFSGGAGLSSTAEDYARFLQLFLNGGEYNGVRLLGRKTVELMLTDQLPALTDEFGLGFGLETPANDYLSPASIGSFSWGGAFNTSYWADPTEDLIGVLYTNIYNTAHRNLGARFKVLVYQAIVD
ncbi:MAG: beta-lactamase family protein [Gemmatimonadota bacterium]|nr:beta-lactamase family protein [Gemmatimonadota bacterium]MDH4350313.1 beta-lactamase family protein [Gemmatimonadota bacterium]MDH5197230.1 beta-lactamase family protein [Gemmatimonadota bacterium]